MGLKCAPDFAQEVMKNILRDIEDTKVYIEDIGIFYTSWKKHIDILDRILKS